MSEELRWRFLPMTGGYVAQTDISGTTYFVQVVKFETYWTCAIRNVTKSRKEIEMKLNNATEEQAKLAAGMLIELVKEMKK